MLNRMTSILVLVFFVSIGVFAVIKPLNVWDLIWGWWLKYFGDVKESHKSVLMRTMGVIYLLLLALAIYDYCHRMH